MDLVANPYSPGAGLRPAVLAGRQDELDTFEAILRRGELGRPSRGLILTGLRGVGKTVLLNELANRAADRDWIIAQLEVRPDGSRALLSTLAALVTAGIRRQQGGRLSDLAKRALRSITAFSVTVDPDGKLGASIDVDAYGSGDLEIDFAALAVDVGKAALEFGTGVAVFVDELQELDKHAMASLAAAAHAAGQRNAPFVVIGAGLPNLPGKLAEAKSYAERLFDYRPLGTLSDTWAAEALVGPAGRSASPGSRTRVDRVLAAADGYPYFLQEFGAAAGTRPRGRTSPPTTPVTGSDSDRPSWTAGSSGRAGTGPPAPSAGTCGPWPSTATTTPARRTSPLGWAVPRATSARSEPA